MRILHISTIGVLAAAAVVTLTGCGFHGLQMDQSPLTKFFAPRVGHIAYVGTDGNVYIGDQSGHTTAVTKDADSGTSSTVWYSTPVWSYDGSRIVFARYEKQGTSQLPDSVAVLVASSNGHAPSTIFSDKALIPFYFSWSPNDKLIGMLSQKTTGDGAPEMGYVSADPGNDYRVVHTDAPYYWEWAPDSSQIIAHTQDGPAQNAPDFVEVDTLGAGGVQTRRISDLQLGAFDAPSVLPDGKTVVVPLGTAEKAQLAVIDLQTNKERDIAAGDNNIFYSVSPDGKRLAYIDQSTANDVSSQVLHVVDLTGKSSPFAMKEHPVLEFYWSPSSQYIAAITPLQDKKPIDQAYAQSQSLPYVRLSVVDVRRHTSWVVARFPMTQTSINDIPFNDQYQRSSTIWSPNSKNLVYTAYTSDGTPGVFVAAADGNLKGSLVVQGDAASWSWK